MILEIKYDTTNWWNYKIYRTKKGIPIIYDGFCFYTLSDPTDIDSDPCKLIEPSKIKIVQKFSK